MASMKATLVSFGDAISKAVLPIIQTFTGKIQQLTNWFTSLTDEQQQNIIKWLGIAAAIGPVLLILGKVVSLLSMVGPLIAALTSPVGLVVLAIAALSAAVLYVIDNWEAIKERVSDIGWWRNALVDMIQFFIETNPISLLIEGFNFLLEKFGKEAIPNPFMELSEGLESLKGETKEYATEFGTFTEALKNGMGKVTGLFGDFSLGGGVSTTSEETVTIAAVVEDTSFNIVEDEILDLTEPKIIPIVPSLSTEEAERFTEELNSMIEGFAADMISASVEGLTVAALEGTQEGWNNFLNSILGNIGNFMKEMGTLFVSYGIVLEAFKNAFASPAVLIAGGIALIAVGSAISYLASEGFEDGGIVGGSSYTGDKIPIRVNSREMILNQGQQGNLFNMIRAGTTGQQSNVPNRWVIEGSKLIGVIDNQIKVNRSF